MQAVNMRDQFSFRGPATEVEAQHLIRPLGRGSSDPQANQQTRNKGRIHLDAHSVNPLTQQMPAAQHTFNPAEKQFYGPPVAIRYGDQLRVQVQPIGDQTTTSGAPSCRVLPVVTCTTRNGCGSKRVWCAVPKRRRSTSRTTPARTAAGVRACSS